MVLRRCNIRKGGFIHGNAGIEPMALHGENIHCDRCVHKNISAMPMALMVNKQFIGLY